MSSHFSEVLDVLENYKSAVQELDVKTFLSTYATDIHIYDCWENWECRGISEWEEAVTEWFKGVTDEGVLLKVSFDDVVVTEEANLAFVHCDVTYAAHDQSGKKLRQITNRFTFGLKKEKESWAIVHEHSSLPISAENGKGIFNKE
ncbi:ketosteroid isomerase-like protein [Pullulanibacillus pueri]|uniref:SnoaL-like domain-containing protein n=1 Tax=Pullulanibacillus pueri TaxID=1437324 RepID=A0A8J3A071_9BACL|nr:nuclear transport factor 2 family protein [Pullulanibacillus pueri]MBM7683921.1 ketosteroid isomerase-like protein [Pullulanibacillus pueri]GGH87935.1 hypothetical protein GCM10007096_39100 [Pullulanibacillus pueri]